MRPSFLGTPDALGSADLSFNPIRLVLLVGWVYLCLYLVQRAYFSPLVPKNYKTLANVVTLFTGPFLLLILFILDTARKSRGTGDSFWLVLKRQIQHLGQQLPQWLAALHWPHSEPEDETALRLLDSSGRSIDEVCGHGDGKHADARILGLTETIIADALERRASDILIDPKDSVRVHDPPAHRRHAAGRAGTGGRDVPGRHQQRQGRLRDGHFGAQKTPGRQLHGPERDLHRLLPRGQRRGAARREALDPGAEQGRRDLLPRRHRPVGEATRDPPSQIAKPAGMILICGPTGSGKTTTMYAMLNEIDRFTRNVITVEDPIEAVLPQASQIEINPKADITFAKALRSVLRQDPDVICVGEIRDEETAEIALRAAQTGHLVLATIHCDSNATALIRLLDLGVSPLLLSGGLSLVMSQRLLRCLCEHCKAPRT